MLEITGFSHYDKLPQSRDGPLLCLPVWWRVCWWWDDASSFLNPWPGQWIEQSTSLLNTLGNVLGHKSTPSGAISQKKRMELHWYMEDADKKWMKAFILYISLKIKLGRSLSSLPRWLAGGLYDNFSVKDNLFGITYTSSCFRWKELLHDHLCNL